MEEADLKGPLTLPPEAGELSGADEVLSEADKAAHTEQRGDIYHDVVVISDSSDNESADLEPTTRLFIDDDDISTGLDDNVTVHYDVMIDVAGASATYKADFPRIDTSAVKMPFPGCNSSAHGTILTKEDGRTENLATLELNSFVHTAYDHTGSKNYAYECGDSREQESRHDENMESYFFESRSEERSVCALHGRDSSRPEGNGGDCSAEKRGHSAGTENGASDDLGEAVSSEHDDETEESDDQGEQDVSEEDEEHFMSPEDPDFADNDESDDILNLSGRPTPAAESRARYDESDVWPQHPVTVSDDCDWSGGDNHSESSSENEWQKQDSKSKLSFAETQPEADSYSDSDENVGRSEIPLKPQSTTAEKDRTELFVLANAFFDDQQHEACCEERSDFYPSIHIQTASDTEADNPAPSDDSSDKEHNASMDDYLSTEEDGSCENLLFIEDVECQPISLVPLERLGDFESGDFFEGECPSISLPARRLGDVESGGFTEGDTTRWREKRVGSIEQGVPRAFPADQHTGGWHTKGSGVAESGANPVALMVPSSSLPVTDHEGIGEYAAVSVKERAGGSVWERGRHTDSWSRGSTSGVQQELDFLRQEVRGKAIIVRRLQTCLCEQQAKANLTVVALRTELRKVTLEAQQQLRKQEEKMSTLLTHLLFLEGQMRQEQRHVLQLLQEKDDTICTQKSTIDDLTVKNNTLLKDLREQAHSYRESNSVATDTASPTMPSTIPLAEDGGERGVKSVEVAPRVVLRNKQSGSKVLVMSGATNAKDKMKRHQSSMELQRPSSMEILLEDCGSRESLSDGALFTDCPTKSRKRLETGPRNDAVKTRRSERQDRCWSMVDNLSRLSKLPEVPSEGEASLDEVAISSFRQPPISQSSSQQLQFPHLPLPLPREHVCSDEEESFSGQQRAKLFRELSKTSSVPLSLVSSKDNKQSSLKARPFSLPGAELCLVSGTVGDQPVQRVSMNPCDGPVPQYVMDSASTHTVSPAGAESSPFRTIKNVFRRRSSKQRSKKRPVSLGQLGQQSSQEYQQSLKEHFNKFHLS